MMTLGGNKVSREFFQGYDLADESVQVKYKTRAAEYFRSKVYCLKAYDVCSCDAWWRACLLMRRKNPVTTGAANKCPSSRLVPPLR